MQVSERKKWKNVKIISKIFPPRWKTCASRAGTRKNRWRKRCISPINRIRHTSGRRHCRRCPYSSRSRNCTTFRLIFSWAEKNINRSFLYDKNWFDARAPKDPTTLNSGISETTGTGNGICPGGISSVSFLFLSLSESVISSSVSACVDNSIYLWHKLFCFPIFNAPAVQNIRTITQYVYYIIT